MTSGHQGCSIVQSLPEAVSTAMRQREFISCRDQQQHNMNNNYFLG